MQRHALEFIAAIALTLAAILASVPGALASDVMVIKGFARASATAQAHSAVAYLTLTNRAGAADRLIGVETPAATTAQMHDTRSVDGVMSMSAVEALDLPPGVSVEMKPGGLHIMLLGLKAPLTEGTTLVLRVHFAQAGEIEAHIPVKGVAATGP